MSTVKLSTIRTRFATSIINIGKGLHESKFPYEAFGKTTNSLAHKAFAIGVGSSSAASDRQKTNIGCYITTDFNIQLAYRLKPLDQLADVNNTLDIENDIIAAVLNRQDGNLYANTHIRLISTSRNITASGEYYLSVLEFEVLNYIPLTE